MSKSLRIRSNYRSISDLYSALSGVPREELIHALWDSIVAQQEWEHVVDSSLDGIFLASSDGRALYANTAYELISGLSRKEIEGVHLKDFLKLGYVDKAGSLMVLDTKQPTTIESFFYRTGKHALITCNPILGPDGNISITVSNVRDLTEINKLKEQQAQGRALICLYKSELEVIKEQLYTQQELVASDPNTVQLLYMAKQIARVDSTVLITGETGVGKEVIAKYIHDNSPRNKGHFIRINCSAIAESLFESELFGYEKGAFTGARSEGKMGLFEIANRGTIFLDEIGELPQHLQAKLLRVLQEKEFTRVGGVTPIKSDVRVLAATNRDLIQMVQNKDFRQDLYYRLNVVPISVPPLRERKRDILPLAELFIREMNKKYNYKKWLSESAQQMILQYSWPGNIRELRNVIERAVILSISDEVDVQGMLATTPEGLPSPEHLPCNLEKHMKRLEYDYMKKAYETYGTIREAAQALGMKRSTFAGKLQAYSKMSP